MLDLSMKGVYPIILTPFDDKNRIVVEDLEREVDFLIAAGAHGLGVANNSEAAYLSDPERELVLATLVRRNRGRLKIVMTASASSVEQTVERARRAEDLGADAVIAKPLPNQGEEPFRTLASVGKLPVFIQDTDSTPVELAVTVRLARETENVRYAKLERQPDLLYIAQAVEQAGDRLTVFGGAGGSHFIEQMKRGSQGFMAAVPIADVLRRVWDLFQGGREQEAEDEFDRFQPLLKATKPPGLSRQMAKEALRLRGVFSTSQVRQPGVEPDAWYYEEVRRQWERSGLKPLVP